jgi:hypothetical protein
MKPTGLVQPYIEAHRQSLAQATASAHKCELLNAIIQLRIECGDNAYYLDAKLFVRYYLDSIEEREYDYEELRIEHVTDIAKHLSPKAALALLNYTYRTARLHGFEHIPEIEVSVNKAEIRLITTNRLWFINPLNYVRIILNFSSQSLMTLIISIGAIFLTQYVMLLPAPYEWMQLFKVEHPSADPLEWRNRLINTLTYWADCNDGFSIHALNIGGALAMVLGEILKILLVAGFLVQEVIRRALP